MLEESRMPNSLSYVIWEDFSREGEIVAGFSKDKFDLEKEKEKQGHYMQKEEYAKSQRQE